MQSSPTVSQIQRLARSGKATTVAELRQIMSGQRARLNVIHERDIAYFFASAIDSKEKEKRAEHEQKAATAVKKLATAEAEWMRQKAIKDRLANEAGLVAFAADPPLWAYPLAWKAAVIAEAEGGAGYQSFVRSVEVAEDFRAALHAAHVALRDGRPTQGGKWARGIVAYAHARPTSPGSERLLPERRRRH